MKASPGDYRAAQQRIYCTPQYPSHMDLPLATQ